MRDFASALYLGLRHGRDDLARWTALTTGAPAALREPRLARRVARDVAALQGCERGTVAPSTLHAFWDLFGILRSRTTAVLVDGGAYPIARWGAERPAACGGVVREFAHHDVDALTRQLETAANGGRRLIVVSDGFCPSCGEAAPIRGLVTAARRHGALVVIDDTQALGVFGRDPGPAAPLGLEGGGMLQHTRTFGGDIVLVSSLAKAFGAPLTVVSGSRDLIDRFEREGDTRVHCSPPSAAVLHAAARAIEVNRRGGDALRLRLALLVRRFRERARARGLTLGGGLFPVQAFGGLSFSGMRAVHRRLLQSGVRTVFARSRHDSSAQVNFLVTARHTTADIDRAVEQLADAVCCWQRAPRAVGVDHGMRMRELP